MNRVFIFLFAVLFSLHCKVNAQNVGIGTANPLSKLHVAGCIRSDTLIGPGVRYLFAAPNGRIYDSLVAPAALSWEIGGNSNITPANFLGTTNANDVIFKTNGVERARILASGNIGIGTIAPNNSLEITSASANTAGLRFTNLTASSPTVTANGKSLSVDVNGDVILVPSTTNAWLLNGNAGTTAGTNFLGTTDAQDMVFKTYNVENMRILNANGNVGIGTNNPTAVLHTAGYTFKLGDTRSYALSPTNRNIVESDGLDLKLIPPRDDTGTVVVLDNNSVGGLTFENLGFSRINSYGNYSTHSPSSLVLQSQALTANVGIGTTTPNNKVEITSAAASTSGLRFTNLTSAAATSASNGKSLSVDVNGDVILVPSVTGAWLLGGNAGTSAGTDFLGTTDAQDLVFKTNNAEHVRILSNGNMRVGTSSYPTQCGGTSAAENSQIRFAVMGGFSSFGNYNNDPAVNNAPPATTWAGGVGAVVLGMNRTAGSSNVDFWNNSDPNNGAAALGVNNRGFNFRNFQSVAGSCSENLLMTLDGNAILTLARYSAGGGVVNAYAFNTISDQRVKRNIQPLKQDVSSRLMQLKPVTYEYADINYEPMHRLEIKQTSTGEEQTGFLAQDVYTIFPQAVHKPADDSKELWSVDYSKLVPLLVKGFQEQQQQIDDLKKEIEQLKSGKN